uniref:G_PROTEIN_RECEP_F1_2 domain-containing protein n=1 Tax=Steinernema glaseri TaxID=37863 RepID=A0A1I7ZG23_9BILA
MSEAITVIALEESNDEGEVSDLCMDIVKISLVFFGIFGIFGNFNIMLATYWHKSLRSKCGLLLAVLAFCDFWCLAFELLSAVRLLINSAQMSRKQCFWSISFYLFIENVETYMIFAVGFDRLLAICLPIKYDGQQSPLMSKCGLLLAVLAFCDFWCLAFELLSAVRLLTNSAQMSRKQYMLFRSRSYIPAIVAPGVVYSLILMIMGIVNLDNSMVPVCNPPLAYPGYTTEVWNYSTMITCVTTVVVYFATYTMLYKIAPKHASANTMAQIRVQKIMVQTLTVNVLAYFSSSLLSALIICIMRALGLHRNAIADAETYAVIPELFAMKAHLGLLSYSINYYVYFWRSSEYRRAFKKQLLFYVMLRKTGQKDNTLFMTRVDPAMRHFSLQSSRTNS